MKTDDIMKALAFDGTAVPEAAIEAAAAMKAEMIPAFIAEIEAFCAIRKPSDAEIAKSPLFVAVLLLGEWRAKAAYPAYCRLMGSGEAVLERLFGDALENSAAIMARVFDTNPRPIFDIILSPTADDFARSQMFQTLVRLAVDGAIERAVVEDFVRSAHAGLEPRRDNMVWAGWVEAVAVLGLDDLAPQAREAILSGRVPLNLMATKHFDADLAHAKAHPEKPWPDDLGFEELEPASVVLQGFLHDESDGLGGGVDPFAPVINPLRDVGRNDPCPCGSGKKFKKCCLGAAPL